MPTEIVTEYVNRLSPRDRLLVRFVNRRRQGGIAELLEFSIVYRSKTATGWRNLRRYDNAHGPPHVHLYDWEGETANTPLGTQEQSPEVFNEALEELKRDYRKIREWYIASRRKYEQC